MMTTSNGVDEEEEAWVPLSSDDNNAGRGDPGAERIAYADSSAVRNAHNRKSSNSSSSRSHDPERNNARKMSDSNSSLQMIQRRLETRLSIHNNLVNHPIELFWKRFFINLIREIWSLETRIRFGLVMLGLGLLTRAFVWSTFYFFYPRMTLLFILFVIGFVYLDPFEVQTQIRTVCEVLFSPDKAVQAMEKLDPRQLRRLSLFLFMIPTFLEMRTLSFLSQIKAEAGWTLYNIGVGAFLLATMLFLMKVKRMKPRDATYQGMLVMYGSALVITIFTFDIRRLPFLAAPFLTATGTLLLTYQDDDMEWISRLVRHTLRLTLRDVLASVGERVTEDEMLQLAILRWISDFWASNPEIPTNSPSPQQSEQQQGSQSSSHSAPETSPSSKDDNFGQKSHPATESPDVPPPSSSSSGPQFHRRDVQWEELLPMLNLEIDHMEAEVAALQSNSDNSGPQNCGMPSDASTSPGSKQQQQKQVSPDMQSFEALKSMLLTLNVNERAKPAVMAYKRAVASFPPEKKTAVAVSFLRRCPALLTLAFHVVFGGTKSLFVSFIILVPFVVMEYYRIIGWVETCRQIAPPNETGGLTTVKEIEVRDWRIPRELESVDTMVILLCGDCHTPLRPPTLLTVWNNIVSSVSALEVGLTAARCAETTAIAVEFAGDVVSLVQFGYEISQKGLFYGLGVVVKEAISIHGAGRNVSDLDAVDDESARYTRAAVRAVLSGQKVARNVHELLEDQHLDIVVKPLMIALGALSGHGWLWGKEEAESDNPGASVGEYFNGVVIEEIMETTAECNDNPRVEGSDIQVCSTSTPDAKNESVIPNPLRNANKGEELAGPQVPSHRSVNYNEDESLLHILSPRDELSAVMDMVAAAYEQNLIEEDEKAQFYEKLSKFNENELLDPSVLYGMKRTLKIIIENGGTNSCCGDDVVDTGDTVVFEKIDCSNIASVSGSSEATSGAMPKPDSSTGHDLTSLLFEEADAVTAKTEDAETQETQSEDNHNDALFKFGVAALGVVAGGILLSMRGEGDNTASRNESSGNEGCRSIEDDNQIANGASTVVIDEIVDDDRDEEWVSVSQQN